MTAADDKRKKRSDLPRRLGEILTPALDRIAGGEEARAYSAWARAVGEPVTRGTRAKAFRRGQLTVECASSVWANELTYLGPQILRRMDEVAPGHPVVRFRFVVGRLPAPDSPEDALEGGAEPVSEASEQGSGVLRGEGEASAPTARAGRRGRGAGPGGGSRGRTTPGGYRSRSATVYRRASGGSRSRHPFWLTKIADLRRFCPASRVDLSLRFWYTHTGRSCLLPTTIAQPLGHCEVV